MDSKNLTRIAFFISAFLGLATGIFLTSCSKKCGVKFYEKVIYKDECTASATDASASSALAYTATVPTISTSYLGSHDTAARTVTFSHNATTIECSHDGGTSYADCDTSNSVIWTSTDYTNSNVIKVRFNKTGYESLTYTVTPATIYSGLSFLSCDVYIVASDTDGSSLTALLANGTNGDRRTICLSAGVDLNSTASSAVAVSNNYVDVVGTNSSSPTIHYINNTADTNNTTNRYVNLTLKGDSTNGDYAIKISGDTNVTLHNVTAQLTGTSTAGAVYSGSIWPDNPEIRIEKSTISNSDYAGIMISHSGFHLATLYISDSTVSTTDSGGSEAVHVNGGTAGSVTITNSTITGSGSDFAKALRIGRALTATITGSTLTSSGYETIYGYNDSGSAATYTITNSTIYGTGPHGDGVITIEADTTVNLTSTTLKRGGTVTGNWYQVRILNSGANDVFTNSGGNTTCVTASGNLVTFAIYSLGGTPGGTYSFPSPITICP